MWSTMNSKQRRKIRRIQEKRFKAWDNNAIGMQMNAIMKQTISGRQIYHFEAGEYDRTTYEKIK